MRTVPYSEHDMAYVARRYTTGTTGFTLIELMVTVAIIGILSSLAMSAYSQYVVRSKLSDTLSALGAARLQIEQSFVDSRNYGVAGQACNYIPANTQYFTMSCTVGATNQNYTLRAVSNAGVGLGNVAGVYEYAVNQSNQQSTPKFAGLAGSATSWQIK